MKATLTIQTPIRYIEQAFRYTVGTNTMQRDSILKALRKFQRLGCPRAGQWIQAVKGSN